MPESQNAPEDSVIFQDRAQARLRTATSPSSSSA